MHLSEYFLALGRMHYNWRHPPADALVATLHGVAEWQEPWGILPGLAITVD
jgi:hypothetical protein